MSVTLTDGREGLVLREMVDIFSRQNDPFDLLFQDMNGQMGNSESLQLASSPSMTVNEATTGSAAEPTDTYIKLMCNRPLSMFITLPQLRQLQDLGGAASISFNTGPGIPANPWAQGTLRDALTQMKNRRAEIAVAYLSRVLAWTSAAATYYNNVESDTLTEADVLGCIAELESLDGAHDIAIIAHPMALASFMAIPGWMPFTAGNAVGFPMAQVGTINGYPVYKSNNITRGRSGAGSTMATAITPTVAALSSGAWTMTLPTAITDSATAGAMHHGLVLGERIYTEGLDSNTALSAAGVTTTATDTSVVWSSGSSTDADLLTSPTTPQVLSAGIKNLVVDRAHLYRCQQILPSVKIADKGTGQTDDELKLLSRFGITGRVGRVRVLMTPYNFA